MAQEPITLGGLAFACYLFDAMAGYDESYRDFRDQVGDEVDLRNPNGGQELLHWLNHWGCRHLATDYHNMAITALGGWYDRNLDMLPATEARLVSASDAQLDSVADIFDSLSGLIVAKRKHGQQTQMVSFAPTATAKTLFALRAHFFVPWDEAMRLELGHDGTGRSYVAYLKGVRSALTEIERQCEPRGISLDRLPAKLGREKSTAAQPIDEYHWITITRKVKPPDLETLDDWVAWS